MLAVSAFPTDPSVVVPPRNITAVAMDYAPLFTCTVSLLETSVFYWTREEPNMDIYQYTAGRGQHLADPDKYLVTTDGSTFTLQILQVTIDALDGGRYICRVDGVEEKGYGNFIVLGQ